MFTQAEIEYIQKQYARGLTADAITNKLIEAGWDKDDIDDGIKEVARLTSISAPSLPVEIKPLQDSKISDNVIIPVQNMMIKSETSNLLPSVPAEVVLGEAITSVAEVIKDDAPIFPNANKPLKTKTVVKTILTIIFVLLILGGLAFAYYQFFYKPSLSRAINLTPTASSTEESFGIDNMSPPLLATTSDEVLMPSDKINQPEAPINLNPVETPSIMGQASSSSSTTPSQGTSSTSTSTLRLSPTLKTTP